MASMDELMIINEQYQLSKVMAMNDRIMGARGRHLVLSREDAQIIIQEKRKTLKELKLVELGESILPRLHYEFFDCGYIQQSDYKDAMIRLQELFFAYREELRTYVTDDEMLNFMREQFDEGCKGDFDLLEGRLQDLAQAIRNGYRGYHNSEGKGIWKEVEEYIGI